MQPFVHHQGIVLPLDRANVDTDQIIPKQFLKRIERTGYEDVLFYDWRYLDDGETPNHDFVLNQPRYRKASILLARENFGCGSSREHAPWSLTDYGFRALLAPSFADIFYNNCFNNGMLPIVLPRDAIATLFAEVSTTPGYTLRIDLTAQTVGKPDGSQLRFDVDPFLKERLLNGWDQISLTLRYDRDIAAYESKHGIV